MKIPDQPPFGVIAEADGCYSAYCRCGWFTGHMETDAGAGEVLRLHVGDQHPDDEGLE